MTALPKQRRKQIHIKFGNNGRPEVKLLKPFDALLETSQDERNSIDTSNYAFEDNVEILSLQ